MRTARTLDGGSDAPAGNDTIAAATNTSRRSSSSNNNSSSSSSSSISSSSGSGGSGSSSNAAFVARHQRWNLRCLCAAFTLYALARAGNLTVVTLVAREQLLRMHGVAGEGGSSDGSSSGGSSNSSSGGDGGARHAKQWAATLPVVLLNAGEVLACLPLARANAALGRRRAAMLAGGLGVAAAAANALGAAGSEGRLWGGGGGAGAAASFALLCVGNLLLGAFGAGAELLRFAAAEAAAADGQAGSRKGKAAAIARVVCGGALLSALGPPLAASFGSSDRGWSAFYAVSAVLGALFVGAVALLRLQPPCQPLPAVVVVQGVGCATAAVGLGVGVGVGVGVGSGSGSASRERS